MFNIALISLTDNCEFEYIKALQEKNWLIHSFNSKQFTEMELEALSTMDAIIIMEPSSKHMEQTCELIIKIRNISNCYMWILSEESSKINRIIYLQLGADANFDGSIDPDEFGLYVSNTLNRRNIRMKHLNVEKELSTNGNVQLIPQKSAVDLEGREVLLTKLEFKLLEILYNHIGEVVSYEKLYEFIWGEEKGNRQYRVANLVFHLRRKLEEDMSKSRYIKTIRSIGYILHI